MNIVEIESAFVKTFNFHKDHHDNDHSYGTHHCDFLLSHQKDDLSEHSHLNFLPPPPLRCDISEEEVKENF